jgi:hypothetical protein
MAESQPDTGTADTPTDTPTEQAPDTGTDLAAEVAKWKALARKHEEKSKALAPAAKELETLKQQTMTELEKAVATAKTEARAEVLREVGASRVDDALRVALAGRPVDVDALLDGLDRSRFLDSEGQPDRDAIASWVDRIAPAQDPTAPAVVDLGQGNRGGAAGSDMALNGDPLLQSLKSKLGVR